MTLAQFRRGRVSAAMALRENTIDRCADDRDAAIGAAMHDYRMKVRAASDAYRVAVDAINAGEFDHEHSGDAA